eukprot:11923533-Alexandrium_andersonii.AAC.1
MIRMLLGASARSCLARTAAQRAAESSAAKLVTLRERRSQALPRGGFWPPSNPRTLVGRTHKQQAQ